MGALALGVKVAAEVPLRFQVLNSVTPVECQSITQSWALALRGTISATTSTSAISAPFIEVPPAASASWPLAHEMAVWAISARDECTRSAHLCSSKPDEIVRGLGALGCQRIRTCA